MKTIEYDGATFTCPMSELFRRHTPAELDAMRDSIHAHGVRHPIRVYHDTDLGIDNCILDGEGRLQLVAASPNGKKVPFKDEGRLSTEEAYELAKVDNDHRRQDDPEAVRKRRSARVARIAEKRAEGKSTRQIAEEEEVSQSQVLADIKRATEQGCSVEPEKVKGKDGRTRAASPNKPPPPSDELVERVATALRKNPKATDHAIAGVCDCTPAEVKAARKLAKKKPADPKPEPTKPPKGETVAQANEREALEHVAEVESLCYDLDGIVKRIDTLAESRFAKHTIHAPAAAASVKAVRKQLWVGRAAHRCPYCKGHGCKPDKDGRSVCNQTGWVKKSTADAGEEAVGAA